MFSVIFLRFPSSSSSLSLYSRAFNLFFSLSAVLHIKLLKFSNTLGKANWTCLNDLLMVRYLRKKILYFYTRVVSNVFIWYPDPYVTGIFWIHSFKMCMCLFYKLYKFFSIQLFVCYNNLPKYKFLKGKIKNYNRFYYFIPVSYWFILFVP